jgi:hypothetical protein
MSKGRNMTEKEKRNKAMERLKLHRRILIHGAKIAADILAREERFVTSTDVLKRMKTVGYNFGQVDKRFMGVVFNEKAGWKRVGFTPKGSHHRPVSIWERA